MSAELSREPDITPQTDGAVFAVLPVGDRIYMGGMFAHVGGVPRDRLAAIDATTGELTGWNPGASGKVFALTASPSGDRIYAAGDFTTVGGRTRNRLAAMDATTGAVDAGFKSAPNKAVRTIAFSGNRLYIGGDFTTVQGQSRAHLAVVDGLTGNLEGSWTPAADNTVRTLVFSPDRSCLYAAGDFTSVSGQSRMRLASLDPENTGAPLPWKTLVNPNGRSSLATER